MAQVLQKIDLNRNKSLKISLKKQIYLILLMQSIINCLVYVIHFSVDLVVAIQYFREYNPVWALSTIFIMYIPALAYFVLAISRPDWWMTDHDKKYKGVFLWFLIQIAKLIAFPFFALYRYAGLIVLSIDAIILSDNCYRTKTLNVAAAPAAIELYFFLQAWMQAIPQAIFQIYLLFKEKFVSHTFQLDIVRILCIIMSVCISAIRTTQFQRYESQRTNGRNEPWAMWLKKYKIQELENFERKQLFESTTYLQSEKNNINRIEDNNENLIHKQDLSIIQDKQNCLTPPLPPKNMKMIPPPTPLRCITSIPCLPVPEMPAPLRPDIITNDSEDVKIGKKSKSLENIKANRIIERFKTLKISKDKNYIICLENDNPFETFIFFLWWFLFILSRVLSLSIFFEFYPVYLLSILGLHYILMIAYLFYYAKYYDAMSFFINFGLAFIFIFSIIEYRVKFKYAEKWLICYYLFVFTQNIFMTLICYLCGNTSEFWHLYSLYIIFICTSLCFCSIIIYYLLFIIKTRTK